MMAPVSVNLWAARAIESASSCTGMQQRYSGPIKVLPPANDSSWQQSSGSVRRPRQPCPARQRRLRAIWRASVHALRLWSHIRRRSEAAVQVQRRARGILVRGELASQRQMSSMAASWQCICSKWRSYTARRLLKDLGWLQVERQRRRQADILKRAVRVHLARMTLERERLHWAARTIQRYRRGVVAWRGTQRLLRSLRIEASRELRVYLEAMRCRLQFAEHKKSEGLSMSAKALTVSRSWNYLMGFTGRYYQSRHPTPPSTRRAASGGDLTEASADRLVQPDQKELILLIQRLSADAKQGLPLAPAIKAAVPPSAHLNLALSNPSRPGSSGRSGSAATQGTATRQTASTSSQRRCIKQTIVATQGAGSSVQAATSSTASPSRGSLNSPRTPRTHDAPTPRSLTGHPLLSSTRSSSHSGGALAARLAAPPQSQRLSSSGAATPRSDANSSGRRSQATSRGRISRQRNEGDHNFNVQRWMERARQEAQKMYLSGALKHLPQGSVGSAQPEGTDVGIVDGTLTTATAAEGESQPSVAEPATSEHVTATALGVADPDSSSLKENSRHILNNPQDGAVDALSMPPSATESASLVVEEQLAKDDKQSHCKAEVSPRPAPRAVPRLDLPARCTTSPATAGAIGTKAGRTPTWPSVGVQAAENLANAPLRPCEEQMPPAAIAVSTTSGASVEPQAKPLQLASVSPARKSAQPTQLLSPRARPGVRSAVTPGTRQFAPPTRSAMMMGRRPSSPITTTGTTSPATRSVRRSIGRGDRGGSTARPWR